MRELPRGTVTFLFTDIEGSTRLLHELGASAYADALAEHRRIVRATLARCGGVEVDTQGDAFFVAFGDGSSALEAARSIASELATGPIRVRMGVHTGSPLVTDEGYVGTDVHRAARIGAAGHGGQIVVSPTTAELCEEGFALAALGTHRLKDFEEPVSLFQLGEGEFPPLKTIANTNLPVPASSFLGRDVELMAADALLRSTRLLTVTGPGGAGKTRFALELARRARDERFSDYHDGVFWVPLVSLRDPALAMDAVAQAIGARDGAREHIGSKRMLLLFDNFEHIVAAASELSALLDACSNLTALVTSRELLRLRAESEYELPALSSDDGLLLFCERAGRSADEDARRLCLRLDGLPLAIELAAARARILAPAELLERLGERLDLLKGGRDAEPRQQTLRATIEWSHELLSDEEQGLFRRLAVFGGGWTFDAAADVVDADLDALQSLFDKSLLRRSEDGRFFMLETIREYAHERLVAAGELEAVRERHANFMLRCIEGAFEEEDRWEGARRLEPERENLRAALVWALDVGSTKTSLILSTGYARLCVYRGPFSEGRRWVDAALQTVRGNDAVPERIKALLAGASLAERQSDAKRARALSEEALRFARAIGDATSMGVALLNLGVAAAGSGDHDRGEALLQEARAIFLQSGDQRNVREVQAMLGYTALARGDFAHARVVIQEGLDRAREADDLRGIFYGLGNLGHVATQEGCYEEALRLLREGVLIGTGQDVQSEGEMVQEVAAVAAAQKHYEPAAVMLAAANALREGTEAELESVALEQYDEVLSALRGNLSEDRFGVAWQRGNGMGLEEVVAYTLEYIDSTQRS